MRSSEIILQGVSLDDLTATITAAVVEQLKPLLAESTAPLLVDGQEMARLLTVSVNSVDRSRANGTIPSMRIGKRRLYDPHAVVAALKANSEKGVTTNE